MTQITDEMKVSAVKAYTEVEGKCRPAAMQKALEVALQFLPIAVEGKVAQLEWRYSEHTSNWYADTPFSQYIAWEISRNAYYLPGISKTPVRAGTTIDEAKAAAQADYEARILSALTSSPGKDGGQEVEAAQITMGRGLVDVTRIEHEGRSGILFRPRAEHIPVGEEGELQPGEYWPVKGDVVIWIENKGGARVIQNYLSAFMPSEQAAVSETSTAEKAAQIAERYNIDPWIVREIRAFATQPASTTLVEAAVFVKAAMVALEGYEEDCGEPLPDDHELGRIDDSRHSPSFRIRVGHIRRLAAALSSSQSTSREGEGE